MSLHFGGLMDIISCKDAKAQGLKRYFTGKACKRGHIAERNVTGGCVICAAEDARRYYKEDPEKYMNGTRVYREQNRERCNEIQRRYYERHAPRIKAEAKTYRGLRALRVPAWSETERIAEFYEACPVGYEVDPILPLQGEFVSGLHVFSNPQYLPRSVNRSKRNKVGI